MLLKLAPIGVKKSEVRNSLQRKAGNKCLETLLKFMLQSQLAVGNWQNELQKNQNLQ